MTVGLERFAATFKEFTTGQKTVAILGTAALVLAGAMIFRWAAAPSYAPLYSGLAPADASAVVDELTAQGVPYELTAGGTTVMVPQGSVYDTRIALSGKGLPSGGDNGYSLLDNQDLSTSQFKEQTDFKRAMEGELSRTIQAIDGVQSAVVHLAMPPKQVFSDQQDPTTASVLVGTRAGTSLEPQQVQAIINLVSSSVDGLKTDNISVTDSTGRVLAAPGGSAGAAASTQTQQVSDFEHRIKHQVQSMLDRVVGAGNSTVGVTADLSFDKATTETV
ncbi:flagellar basal-body MS-ring/collar protein FliF, partial [Nocardioides massiliensis]